MRGKIRGFYPLFTFRIEHLLGRQYKKHLVHTFELPLEQTNCNNGTRTRQCNARHSLVDNTFAKLESPTNRNLLATLHLHHQNFLNHSGKGRRYGVLGHGLALPFQTSTCPSKNKQLIKHNTDYKHSNILQKGKTSEKYQTGKERLLWLARFGLISHEVTCSASSGDEMKGKEISRIIRSPQKGHSLAMASSNCDLSCTLIVITS